jgi:ABC-2 type transport system ATP-binding protein
MIPAVRVVEVSKRFGRLQALDGISFEIAPGEFFGLLGPNGAGKTTLINALAGLVRPDAGRIEVGGYDVAGAYRPARQRIGVVPQELVFDPFLTVRETLTFQGGYYGVARQDPWIDEVMHHLDLTDKASTNMRRLSGGMKRRVLVAQALVHRPPVIVLDEPTAGVDVELRRGLWHFIRRLNQDGHTIILTTHYLEEAEALCGRIALLKAGRLLALEDKATMLARLGGRYLSILLADGATLPADLAARAALDEEGCWRLPFADWQQLESTLALLRATGCSPVELRLSEPDLESAFVSLLREPA